MATFQQRLRAAQRGGNLTVADLARWFDAPYGTVRGWAQDGHAPAGGELDRERTERMLECLEAAVRRRDGLPLDTRQFAQRSVALDAVRAKVLRTARRPA